jgi:molybdopterin biosynthesis enzyme
VSERHDRLISPAEAEALIRANAAALPATSLPLTELVGTILRERIVAGFDQPLVFQQCEMSDARARTLRTRT